MQTVSKIKVNGNLKESIKSVVDALGGGPNFIKSGEKIFLKPNFNTADPYPASSDFEFLKAVIELVYDFGAKQVILGDACTFYQNTKDVLKKKNAYELEKVGPNTKVMNFTEYKWIKKTVPNGKYLKNVSIPEILERVDKLILLPCMKTHSWAQFTGALKLSVGFMKPSERLLLHASHLQEKIAELNLVINPDLIIMDGRKCFITKGPSEGEIREPGVILASKSRVDIDIEGMKIIKGFPGNSLEKIDPENIIQIKRSRELGIR